MIHLRQLNSKTLAKRILSEADTRIEIRVINSEPIRYHARLIFSGSWVYDAIDNDPVVAIDKAFYLVCGEEYNPNELSTINSDTSHDKRAKV